MALADLLHSNRLALVVLAAHVAGMGGRAKRSAAESAARWLARNAHNLRLFLQSLSFLQEYTGRAGYRAIRAARRGARRRLPPHVLRLRSAPRLPSRRHTATLVGGRHRLALSHG